MSATMKSLSLFLLAISSCWVATVISTSGGVASAFSAPCFTSTKSIPFSPDQNNRMSGVRKIANHPTIIISLLSPPSTSRDLQRQSSRSCSSTSSCTRGCLRLMMAATKTTTTLSSSSSNNADDKQQTTESKDTQLHPQQQLPQVFATGYSSNPSLSQALRESIAMASSNLPIPSSSTSNTTANNMIDLAIVFVSSLYADISSVLVPQLLQSVMEDTLYTGGVQHLMGCTAGGIIGCTSTPTKTSSSSSSSFSTATFKSSTSSSATTTSPTNNASRMRPTEAEGTPAISVTLALLPDVKMHTFYIDGRDVPDSIDDYRYYYDSQEASASASRWKKAVGLVDGGSMEQDKNDDDDDTPIFMILPSPAFQNNLDDFLRGIRCAFPRGQILGGIASTVSSLSRARIFSYSSSLSSASLSSSESTSFTSSPPLGKDCTRGDGCVGIMMRGDIQVDTMIAQGAKPVGGVYRVVATGGDGRKRAILSSDDGEETDDGSAYDEACRSTIGAIVLDEDATVEDAMEADDENNGDKEEKEQVSTDVKRARLLADYAKARIPKPPLAEANFVMKSLSDDDRAYMRRALLIGLERTGIVGRTPNELLRLAKGEGHRFTVRQVASAGMKDGSVTFPLGSVNINVGDRCRFFVRDGEFAKREVEALWIGYKKKELKATLMGGDDGGNASPPTSCFVLPTLDRGAKLFGGKPGYESGMAANFLPGITSIAGFFTNGVLGTLDGAVAGVSSATMDGGSVDGNHMLHGSSSQYVVFRSKSRRPFYSPLQAELDALNSISSVKEEVDNLARQQDADDERRTFTFSINKKDSGGGAPRAENGELFVRRREIHSGRSLSVSTVEWSVAERTAKPTSALEGYMWEKETQVDRMRERFPLAQVMSQTKAAMIDPTTPKPRDWIGQVKRAGSGGNFVIIPECKRMEPVYGSLRKRYDVVNLVKQLTLAGAPAISVNSDGVLFGGSMDDIRIAREASSSAAVSFDSSNNDGVVPPPVLASDLLLYPYQLYKLRLAGADAVTLVVAALESKDLLYLTKIAKTIQLQVVASVTSEVQINMLSELESGSISALVISNRDMETFDFDISGGQALALLQSDAIASFREKNNKEVPVLIEGRVGIVGTADGNRVAYIKALKDAGAFGAIVGGGLAEINDGEVSKSIVSWSL